MGHGLEPGPAETSPITPKIGKFFDKLAVKSHSWPMARLHDSKTVFTFRLVHNINFLFDEPSRSHRMLHCLLKY